MVYQAKTKVDIQITVAEPTEHAHSCRCCAPPAVCPGSILAGWKRQNPIAGKFTVGLFVGSSKNDLGSLPVGDCQGASGLQANLEFLFRSRVSAFYPLFVFVLFECDNE